MEEKLLKLKSNIDKENIQIKSENYLIEEKIARMQKENEEIIRKLLRIYTYNQNRIKYK